MGHTKLRANIRRSDQHQSKNIWAQVSGYGASFLHTDADALDGSHGSRRLKVSGCHGPPTACFLIANSTIRLHVRILRFRSIPLGDSHSPSLSVGSAGRTVLDALQRSPSPTRCARSASRLSSRVALDCRIVSYRIHHIADAIAQWLPRVTLMFDGSENVVSRLTDSLKWLDHLSSSSATCYQSPMAAVTTKPYSWNTTIDDTSSILSYTPYADGVFLNNGWVQWYSDYPSNVIRQPGDYEAGQSFHRTSLSGASVALQFNGTAIYLYGSTNCSYVVTLDGNPYPTTLNQSQSLDGLLFSRDGLDSNVHTVNLTAVPESGSDQQIAFDEAVFTNVINDDVDALTTVTIQNTNYTVLQYNGNWSSAFDHQIPSLTNPVNFSTTSQPMSSVSMNFTRTVAIAINASRNWGHWTYNVSLDGKENAYNASTFWLIGDTILYYENNLDPNETHQLELVNTGNMNYYALSLNYITLWTVDGGNFLASSEDTASATSASASSASSTTAQSANGIATSSAAASPASSGKHVNVGTIVGPIVAVVTILLVGVAAFLWWRRRRTLALASVEVALPPPGTVEPFPRGTRPDLWYKGIEADPNAPQPVTYVLPVTSGKRAQDDAPAPPPPPPAISAVADSSTNVSRNTALQSVEPPSTASASALRSSPPPQVVDVNQIIELIAQRIDPAVGRPPDDTAPPRYHG
ncbi:hypothetical protein NM688_g5515 [Phlebia brevispora]|uniref:Uncharacterized protein n=1 Tax=Phlebia brevispora TaxID=194682 RepID=A0ACC1SUC5_9APHY|nr:hypothetical protein NM688_g5515 [Phlebia brevispora]